MNKYNVQLDTNFAFISTESIKKQKANRYKQSEFFPFVIKEFDLIKLMYAPANPCTRTNRIISKILILKLRYNV